MRETLTYWKREYQACLPTTRGELLESVIGLALGITWIAGGM